MPTNLIRFERLAALSLVISVLALALGSSMGSGQHPATWVSGLVVSGLVVVGLAIIATVSTGGGLISATARLQPDWLRWAYLVVFVLAVAADAWTIPTAFAAHSPLVQALTVGACSTAASLNVLAACRAPIFE
jgi:hypothetical protein